MATLRIVIDLDSDAFCAEEGGDLDPHKAGAEVERILTHYGEEKRLDGLSLNDRKKFYDINGANIGYAEVSRSIHW